MNPNILNQNPLLFFDRAVNAQRSQLLTVMADAVSECRTAADQAAELNETGQVGLLRLAEIWSAIRAKEGMGGLVLEGTEAKILSDVVAQFYAYLSGSMFNDPVGMAIYGFGCGGIPSEADESRPPEQAVPLGGPAAQILPGGN